MLYHGPFGEDDGMPSAKDSSVNVEHATGESMALTFDATRNTYLSKMEGILILLILSILLLLLNEIP